MPIIKLNEWNKQINKIFKIKELEKNVNIFKLYLKKDWFKKYVFNY